MRGAPLGRNVQNLLASGDVEAACFKRLSHQMLSWAELAIMFLRDFDKAFVASGDDMKAGEEVRGRANEARG